MANKSTIKLDDISSSIKNGNTLLFIHATTPDGEVYSSGHYVNGYSGYSGDGFTLPVDTGTDIALKIYSNPAYDMIYSGIEKTTLLQGGRHELFDGLDAGPQVSRIDYVELGNALTLATQGTSLPENHAPVIFQIEVRSPSYVLLKEVADVRNLTGLKDSARGIMLNAEIPVPPETDVIVIFRGENNYYRSILIKTRA